MKEHVSQGRHPNKVFLTSLVLLAFGWGAAIAVPAAAQELELQRSRIDVTNYEDLTTEMDLAHDGDGPVLLDRVGPGSAIIVTIPDEGRFGCTANFIWESGGQRYLGAAGHCFLPSDKKATHGPGADYDASGVTVQVCVHRCDGNFRTMQLVGTLAPLGKVAYARQTDPTGEEDVGNDFGVVELPRSKILKEFVEESVPVFHGPTENDGKAEPGTLGCHYGNGLVVGETSLTKARIGLFGGGDRNFWVGDFAAAFGDSGSPMITCGTPDFETGWLKGQGAVGVLTHLGVSVCPCDVNFKNLKIKAQHGVIFGTTVDRAIEMGSEAGLNLSVALPPV